MTSGSESVYNATTTQLNIINNSGWRRRFILICGLLLLFIGLVVTIVFSFSPGKNVDGVASSSTEEHVEDDSNNWIVFITGVILISLGIIVLFVYFLFSRRLASSSRGLIILPKPKQRVLVVEQDKNTNTTSNEEKAELMRNELKNERKENEQSKPAHLNHYKPRNFNQHGYGTQPYPAYNQQSQQRPASMAPIVTLEDEFDCSLRSSMNSVWSEHVHKQIYDCRDDDDDELDSDTYSFRSVVLP